MVNLKIQFTMVHIIVLLANGLKKIKNMQFNQQLQCMVLLAILAILRLMVTQEQAGSENE